MRFPEPIREISESLKPLHGIYREMGIIKQDTGNDPGTDLLAVALVLVGERGSAFTSPGPRGVVEPAASDTGLDTKMLYKWTCWKGKLNSNAQSSR